jgi:hypothetical protein
MTDEELCKGLRLLCFIPTTQAADRIEALTEVRDTMGHLWAKEAADKQVALGRIEALTEQLEAARADAKEAEAYAEELAKDQVDLCSQLIAAEDKLAKAVEALREIVVDDTWGLDHRVYMKCRKVLREIEGEKT